MVCSGIWKWFIKQETIPYEKFKKIMKQKEDTIDVLCKHIAKLKKQINENKEVFYQHNLFLKEKNLYDEYRSMIKEKKERRITPVFAK